MNCGSPYTETAYSWPTLLAVIGSGLTLAVNIIFCYYFCDLILRKACVLTATAVHRMIIIVGNTDLYRPTPTVLRLLILSDRFLTCVSYTAHVIDIGWTSVCLSAVRPSHAGIVSKRLNLSSNCLHCLVAPWF